MKHSHYFKDCPYDKIDVYRVIDLFGVTNAPLQHALKKILCTGNRGHKDFLQDLNDIKDSVQRAIDMVEEDSKQVKHGWMDISTIPINKEICIYHNNSYYTNISFDSPEQAYDYCRVHGAIGWKYCNEKL